MAIKVEKLDHFTFQVWDLDKATEFFTKIFGTIFGDTYEQQKPIWDLIGRVHPLGFAVEAPRTPEGAMAKALKKRGEGLGCLAFKVYDLDQAADEMKKFGVREVARASHGGYREIFYHPKDCFGILLSLCEYTPEVHPMTTAMLQLGRK